MHLSLVSCNCVLPQQKMHVMYPALKMRNLPAGKSRHQSRVGKEPSASTLSAAVVGAVAEPPVHTAQGAQHWLSRLCLSSLFLRSFCILILQMQAVASTFATTYQHGRCPPRWSGLSRHQMRYKFTLPKVQQHCSRSASRRCSCAHSTS